MAVFGLSSLISGLRRHPVAGLPALLATLPWCPVPVPAIALLWTGPLAWLPVGLTVVIAVATGTAWPSVRSPRTGAILAAACTLVATIATAGSIGGHVPGGDEPHYLVITQSLLRDGDLRIQNNHDRGDYREYYGGPLAPHVLERSRDGAIYSIHSPGTSVLVLPGFALAGYTGAKWTMLLLATITAVLVWQAAFRATGDAAAATFAWIGVAGSATFLLQSGMIFPDAPGALAVAAGVWLFVRLGQPAPVRAFSVVAVASLLALLPWLHTRFAALAAPLALAVMWRLRQQAASPTPWRTLVTFLAVPIVSAVAWFTYFLVIYGTLSPMAPYGSTGGSVWYVPGGFVASLFDAQYGLLAYTPVLAAALLGWRRGGGTLLAIAAVYLAAVATYWMWWAGLPATPARFATAALPLCGVPLAIAWRSASSSFRVLLLAGLVISLAISGVVIAVDRGALAWNYRDAQPLWLEWLAPVVNLPRALPSFFWQLSVADGAPDLASEWPFVIHAAMVAGVLAIACVIAVAVVRRLEIAAPAKAGIAMGVLLTGVMIAAQLGWVITRSAPLDAARSQIAMLDRAVAGERIHVIRPVSVRGSRDAATLFRITGEEPGVYGRAPWGVFRDLPAGRYHLRVSMSHPVAAEARIDGGRDRRPIATAQLAAVSEQSLSIDVPSQGTLIVRVEADVRPAGGRVELRRAE